jgi:CheY-like chemotaxis protein
MSRHRILIVDDDVDLRETLISVLEDAGYDAIGAENGARALERLRGPGPRPCLIFLDLMMPIMDGQEFRERQLEDPALADIPVIVISAYRDVASRAAELALAHLAKPIRIADLREQVHRICPDGSLPAQA